MKSVAKRVSPPVWSWTFGVILIAAGFGVPSAPLINLFLANPAGPGTQAVLGVLFLRIGLVLLGVVTVLLGLYPTAPFASAPSSTRPTCRGRELAALCAILVLATVLRLYRLDQQLWLDEIMLHVRYIRSGFDRILTTFDPNNHVFYSILSKLSVILLGDSPWALRLPAALFGIASIGALYLFATFTLGAREALLSAGLLSVSYHHIWFSQNARGYTGLLFFTMVSSYLLLLALERRSARFWIAYAVCTAVGIYTLDMMVVVVAAQFIIYVAREVRGSSRPWADRLSGLVFGFALAGVMTFTLTALLLPQKLSLMQVLDPVRDPLEKFSSLYRTPIAREWNDPRWVLAESLEGLEMSLGSFVILGALVVFGCGCWRLAREKRWEILGLFFLPVFGLVALKFSGYILFPRFFFFTLGFATLIGMSGLVFLGDLAATLFCRRLNSKWGGNAAGLLVILVSACTVPKAYAPKQDYVGALQFIETNRVPGDAAVTVSHTTTLPYREYYAVDWAEVSSPEELAEIGANASRIWLVYTLPLQLESESPELFAVIRDSFTEQNRFFGTLGGGDIVVCSLETPNHSEHHDAQGETIPMTYDWDVECRTSKALH